MSVAVELMPVTGQTLPLISSGGTSIWMTCLSIGIILSVSRKYESKNEEIDNTNPLEILKETI
jgi:cell division protein FtsW